jgi:RHS repeat-associated protein
MWRRQTLSVNTSPSALTTTYGYDNASRLQTVNDGNNNSATYTYVANSPLVSQIAFKQSTTTRMTTTKSYDLLNRLSSIANTPSTLPVASFSYAFNLANQRTQQTEVDGSQWKYQYDSLGQVKSAKKSWSAGNLVEGQQFTNVFDDIGNRTLTGAGGDGGGAYLRTATYTANSLNQYQSRDIPGYLDILGLALVSDTVTVNGQSTSRNSQYFRKELTVANSTAPVWQSITVAATGSSSATGYRFVTQTPEAFTYDLDGNLTQDGRWNYTWDAENRVIKVESLSSAPTASKRRVTWEYDCRGRRIRQTTYDGSSGSYVITEDLKFVSDGWNLIAELAAANNGIVRSYLWGNDLSGSLRGAGGVGGLLAMSYHGTATTNAFVGYDGNGNVAALVNTADGSLAAKYEYAPFGDLLRASGPLAKVNPIRFSSKYQDGQSDLLYYGYRYYNPSIGRWLDRDPIEEKGGINLYEFVSGDPIFRIDGLGLTTEGDIIEFIYSATGAQFNEVADEYESIPGSIPYETSYEAGLLRKTGKFLMSKIAIYRSPCPNPKATKAGAFFGRAGVFLAGMVASDGEAAEGRLAMNVRRGRFAESAFFQYIERRGYRVVGRRISVETPLGRRVIDYVIEKFDKVGEYIGMEIKADKAVLKADQVAKDALINEGNAKVVGEKAAKLLIDRIDSTSAVNFDPGPGP